MQGAPELLTEKRDHGGGLDAAVKQFGGARSLWMDLSTGINPVPYEMPQITDAAWTALPDRAAQDRLIAAARTFWQVPEGLAILPVPGASAAIAQIPRLARTGSVRIPGPTYNEHAASFAAAGWDVGTGIDTPEACVAVHPNNPDGKCWKVDELAGDLRIIDESFCDIMPEMSLVSAANHPGTLVLKSFGKFWGLAGLRLGFVIGAPHVLERLSEMLGPWPVSGPALEIGAAALQDHAWAQDTRDRLKKDSARMDLLLDKAGTRLIGGTPLFRLYKVSDAQEWQTRLAQHHIWSRIFPYNPYWLRLGLPGAVGWDRLEAALR